MEQAFDVRQFERRPWSGRLHAAIRGEKVGPVALGVLLGGLALAIALDGSLPVVWTRALFAALFIANLIVADWLLK